MGAWVLQLKNTIHNIKYAPLMIHLLLTRGLLKEMNVYNVYIFYLSSKILNFFE